MNEKEYTSLRTVMGRSWARRVQEMAQRRGRTYRLRTIRAIFDINNHRKNPEILQLIKLHANERIDILFGHIENNRLIKRKGSEN